MSENPSFFNYSLLEPHIFSIYSFSCFLSSPGLYVFSAYRVTYIILMFPLCIFILYSGFQQLWQNRSNSSTISHCDSFTYHDVIMEVISLCGCIVSFYGNCVENLNLYNVGVNIFSFTLYGQIFFHNLTCVERYLAVVHPVTYLRLRNERGIRIRNVTIGCSWLLCSVGISVISTGNYIVMDASLLITSTMIISFCSLSVLCVLIRPAPGKQDKTREKVDKSKQKAFYTIVAILGILILRLSFDLVWAGYELSGRRNLCIMSSLGVWINLPSSLALPLLFIQRKTQFLTCKKRFS